MDKIRQKEEQERKINEFRSTYLEKTRHLRTMIDTVDEEKPRKGKVNIVKYLTFYTYRYSLVENTN